MKTIAIVILNWNGRTFLEKYLPSVITHSSLPGVSVIIADNGSTDDSLSFLKKNYPQTEIIALDKNYGFAGGYNKALQTLSHDYFILLNSDVEVTPNWITPVIEQMEADPLIAAAMPKIKACFNKSYFEYAGAAGGFIDQYGYPFCRGRIMQNIEPDYGQYDQVTEIFWASGACLFIRSSAFRMSGGFDESFFAHMEEIDLCWRMKNKGLKIIVCPQSTVYHAGGGTLPYTNPHKLYLNFRNSLSTLYKNTNPERLPYIISIRLLLDFIALLQFILRLQFAHAAAIIRGYRTFFLSVKRIRSQYPSEFNIPNDTGLLRKSIVIQFYLFNRKKFSDISF